MPGGRTFKYDDVVIAHLMIVYSNDIEKVGKHMGADYWTIALHCKRMGLKGKGRSHLYKFTNSDFVAAFDFLRGNVVELAIHFDCSASTIKNAMRRVGITTRRQNRKRI